MAEAAPRRGMQDMTQGPIRTHVVRLTLFMLAGMLLQTAYSLVDIYWVGQLGKEAVAAVSLATNLGFVTLALSQMIGVGVATLVSQAAGRKDEAEVQRAFNQGQSLALWTGLAFLLGAFAARDVYAERIAGDIATSALTKAFLDWYIPALALQFSMIGLGSALRGVGNMRPGLVAQMGSVLLNLLLAPFLIFGWVTHRPFGVAGAAMATFIATVAAVAGLALYLARRATFFRVDLRAWRADWALWRRMVSIGFPAGAEFMLMALLFGVFFAVIARFGPEGQAGFGIGMRIMQAGFMPAISLSFAVAAVAGQNYGGGQMQRVRETFAEGARLNVAFMLLFTLLCHLAPAALMRLFTHDAAVVDVGVTYLRIVSYNYVAFGLIVVAQGLFQGMGNTWPSLLASAIRVAVVVGCILWLTRRPAFALSQLWTVSVVSVTLQMTVALLLLRREFHTRLGTPAPASG
ncbi:MAG TPA: MATE family efflux transporter [Candidatus Binatia bacterium]|nr:MATE family efflux transporter [Candidatus Binatia bacterium]